MDKRINTASTNLINGPIFLGTTEQSIDWLRVPAPVHRMIAADEFEDDLEDDDWVEDDDVEEDDDWVEDDDLEEDDDDDDDFEEDFDDDFEDDSDEADDYEYEYRGDPSWDVGDDVDDDEYSLLGNRFSSLLDDPVTGPRRFRDSEGGPKGDKKPKKSHRPRVTNRKRGEIENDDD